MTALPPRIEFKRQLLDRLRMDSRLAGVDIAWSYPSDSDLPREVVLVGHAEGEVSVPGMMAPPVHYDDRFQVQVRMVGGEEGSTPEEAETRVAHWFHALVELVAAAPRGLDTTTVREVTLAEVEGPEPLVVGDGWVAQMKATVNVTARYTGGS